MRKAFGDAIDAAIRTASNVAAVAAHVDLTDDAVRSWIKGGSEPPPLTVFAVERFLELPPGDLSRHLGYAPVGSVSVTAAIDADEGLSDDARRILRVTYREARRS